MDNIIIEKIRNLPFVVTLNSSDVALLKTALNHLEKIEDIPPELLELLKKLTISTDKEREPTPQIIDGILIDPPLPLNFDSTAKDGRPYEQREVLERVPYIVTGNPKVMVRCLDGGAWDRSSCKGCFDTLEEAIAFVKKNY